MLAVRAPQIDRAWRFVAVAFVITMVSTGLSFAIGPLVSPLLADFGLEPIRKLNYLQQEPA